MASLGTIFGNVAAFLKQLGGSLVAKPVPADQAHLQEPLQRFLFGFTWLGNGGTHHRRAMYNAAKEEMYFEMKNGRIYTVKEYTLAEATTYFFAPSKGTHYWDTVRVRGEGHGHETQKPYHKGLG